MTIRVGVNFVYRKKLQLQDNKMSGFYTLYYDKKYVL